MTRLYIALFGHLVGWLSIIQTIYLDRFNFFPQAPELKALAVIVAVMLAIAALWITLKDILKNSPVPCKSEIKINQEMRKIVGKPGRLNILSRNLSWAKDAEILSTLKRKAKEGDLAILLESENEISRQLNELGANILLYENLGRAPECRFTIVGFGSVSPTLYIAHLDDGIHTIYQYQRNSGPVFHLANDLIKTLEKACA